MSEVKMFNPNTGIRRNGKYICLKGRNAREVHVSQELDYKMGWASFVKIYIKDGILTITETTKNDEHALRVLRYHRKSEKGSILTTTRINSSPLGEWLLENGYEIKKHIPLIERRPGIWAEDK